MPEKLFTFRDVAKFYQGRQVLGIEDLSIAANRVTALNGHNGSGKSTLLRMLALLLKPDRGEVRYLGAPAGENGASLAWRREVTMVGQEAYLFSTSVFNNVAYGLKLRGLARERRARRVTLALEAVGLAGFEKRKARQLSGGEGQRVALARALALKPRAVLLDEPFSSLDPESSQVFESVISQLPGRGCTVVLVSHFADQVERLAHRVITLEAGRILADKPGGAE